MIEQKIAQWHHDRNLIEGSTDIQQFSKLLEEVCELWAAINPGQDDIDLALGFKDVLKDLVDAGRVFKPVSGLAAKVDAMGDIGVVLINMAERDGVSLDHCLDSAYRQIKDRKGKMVDGVFVKEEDL